MLRRVAGLIMFGLGLWLGWMVFEALSLYVERGASISDFYLGGDEGLLEIIRFSGIVLMVLGGLLTVANTQRGGTIAGLGAILFLLSRFLWSVFSPEAPSLNGDIMLGLGAIALSVLILTLRRA